MARQFKICTKDNNGDQAMRGRSSFISDMAQMANGAASALGGLREELDNIVKQRTERSLNARGLVTREEFDALRTRHEALAAVLRRWKTGLMARPRKCQPKRLPKKLPQKLPRKLANQPRNHAPNLPRNRDSRQALIADIQRRPALPKSMIIFASEQCR